MKSDETLQRVRMRNNSGNSSSIELIVFVVIVLVVEYGERARRVAYWVSK